MLALVCCFAVTSCAQGTQNLPPIKVIGKWQGKPVEVTVYPDGSKPTEVIINGLPDGPIVIDTTKKS